jgi:hypothetical protein
MTTIVIKILPEGMPVDKMEADESGDSCPLPTQDIKLNIENRQEAIDEYQYGPLNPELDETGENNDFWEKIAKTFKTSVDAAIESRCGNCAAFNQTPEILNCIAKGIGESDVADPYDSIDAGDLGYCQFLKFKCASNRVCDAWVSGGPITSSTEHSSRDIL